MARLHGVKVPCGPIHTVGEALSSQQAQARGAVVEVAAPGRRPAAAAGQSAEILGDTRALRPRAPPHVGQDTREVLRTWVPKDAKG